MIFNPPPTASLSFKKLCTVRDKIRRWLDTDKYNFHSVYKDLLGSNPLVQWSKLVWNRSSIPKAQFFYWMVMLNRLKTRDRLKAIGVIDDDLCPMSGEASESADHIFFHCPWSHQCLSILNSWLGTSISSLSSIRPSKWKVSKFEKKVITTSLCSLIYQIWKTCNDSVWNLRLALPSVLMKSVKLEVKHPLFSLYPHCV